MCVGSGVSALSSLVLYLKVMHSVFGYPENLWLVPTK